MNRRGAIAIAAVATSIPMIPCIGRIVRAIAPSGGEMMFNSPCIVWFSPATRVRCLSGTIRAVEADIAGQWNPPPIARAPMIT